ncbi:radical SAM protein [Butyrivibrio sp. DSM 10294]|uniref:radical SAM protein n=1 Tax=Butyrivibrio sp. DSM 10294 TaxID=2972457 RepID=UPI00234ED124|nr:radical SAM protein [Butyrivibrio sp. DSM 10294]
MSTLGNDTLQEEKEMINAIVFGQNIYSQYLIKFMENGYNKVANEFGKETIHIIAYWNISHSDPLPEDGIASIDSNKAKEMIETGQADILLIASQNYAGQQDFLSFFFSIGLDLDNIYIVDLESEFSTPKSIVDALIPYYSFRRLPYLEFHIADHCNLNCANCEHYSGLVKTPVFPDFAKFSQDLNRLKLFFDEISLIRILGGEPLLNPEIEDYIKLVGSVYPNAMIHIVTNALLLQKMPDSFFDTLKNCHDGSGIWISLYPVMNDKIDDLKSFLNEKGVAYGISDINSTFRKQQKLERSDDESLIKKFNTCFQKGCVNLYDGKIAACFLPFTTKYFNQYFNESLPEDGAVDLYEECLTTEIIRQRISKPFERCRYCAEPVDGPWHTIHNPSTLDDWVL